MALTDTFVKNVKANATPSGEKHTDGQGMYLHVKGAGKYWRMNYRFHGKQKTLALGVYPAVSLAKARQRRDKARELLADGIDPSTAKRAERKAAVAAAKNTFESVSRDWLTKTAARRAGVTQEKVTAWLEKDLIPFIGQMPISSIGPRDVLAVVRRIEMRGAIDTAHRVKQLCGQVLRFAVVSGLAERDVTADLNEALAAKVTKHHAAITDPTEVGALMRSIHAYAGHPCTVAALKLSPLVFVRPGELRKAEWKEINLDLAEWRIPGTKMKMQQDHIVPLSAQAVAILRGIRDITGHGC